jgi:hypothetical protein
MARTWMKSSVSTPLSIDCRGLQIIENAAWDIGLVPEKFPGHKNARNRNWGFLIYRALRNSASGRSSFCPRFIGAIGPIDVTPLEETCLGIPVQSADNSKRALIQFVLACGLSILEQAQLEMGDTLVISGINPLALSVLAAAQTHGSSRILCLVPPSEARVAFRGQVEKAVFMTMDFAYSHSFDSLFDEFLASSTGKTVFIDTTGDPDLVYSMATRLNTFGKMIFCRQDADSSVMMNICNLHHLKSAHFIYWSRVESFEDTLPWCGYILRAGRLLNYKRLAAPISDLFRFFSNGEDATIRLACQDRK